MFSRRLSVDADVPVFDNCVSQDAPTMLVPTETGSDSAIVTWDNITATDSNGEITITSNYVSPVELSIGSYEVEYQAVDTSGNIAFCRWTIVVFSKRCYILLHSSYCSCFPLHPFSLFFLGLLLLFSFSFIIIIVLTRLNPVIFISCGMYIKLCDLNDLCPVMFYIHICAFVQNIHTFRFCSIWLFT